MNRISPIFLRRMLLLDALASGTTALLLLLGAGPLEGLLGLPAGLLRGAGLLLVPFTLFVGYVGLRESEVRGAVAAIVLTNAAWVAGSIVLLLSGWVAPTMLGYVFVLAQAAAVALLAELQWIGLRRRILTA